MRRTQGPPIIMVIIGLTIICLAIIAIAEGELLPPKLNAYNIATMVELCSFPLTGLATTVLGIAPASKNKQKLENIGSLLLMLSIFVFLGCSIVVGLTSGIRIRLIGAIAMIAGILLITVGALVEKFEKHKGSKSTFGCLSYFFGMMLIVLGLKTVLGIYILGRRHYVHYPLYLE